MLVLHLLVFLHAARHSAPIQTPKCESKTKPSQTAHHKAQHFSPTGTETLLLFRSTHRTIKQKHGFCSITWSRAPKQVDYQNSLCVKDLE